jgi:glycosyltransferase involved in cell wall biosynthesis
MVSKKRPDVALAFFGIPGGAVALALKLFTKIPYVVSLRGGDVPGFRPYDFAVYHKIMGPLIKLVWRHASAVVANSQGLKSIAAQFNGSIPIEVIPNGINSTNFYPGERELTPARLLFVGRLVYQKGGDILLDALAKVKDHDWELSIVGDGPRRPDWENQADKLGIKDRVHFRGWLDKADLLKQYQKANIFVLPSRHEGMPNVVLEAMGCGLPVIATRIAGSEDLVLDGTTGYLINPDNPQELSEALLKLIDHREDIKRMGEAARARVVESFSWDSVADRYLTLLTRARNT